MLPNVVSNMGMTGFRISRMLIADTGTYNPQYRRPYQTSLDGSTLQALQERLAGTTKVTPGLIAGVANSFLRQQATPEGGAPVAISNGWDTRRLRFMLRSDVTDISGITVSEIVMGYTDVPGMSLAGAIDPNMVFIINSVVRLRNTTRFTPLGNQTYSSVVDTSHVLADNNWSGMLQQERTHRMRPEDVYSLMSRTHLPTAGGTFDMRSALTGQAIKSKRSNNLASNYMAGILENYKNAYMEMGAGEGMQEILTQARGFSAESPVAQDPFLRTLNVATGRQGTNYFTFQELRAMDPNVDNVCVYSARGEAQRMANHSIGQTQEWGGSDMNTWAASVLSQQVPSIMMDLALTRLVFQASNQNFGNAVSAEERTVISIMDIHGFGDGDNVQEAEQFKVRLFHHVLQDLSYNDQFDYNIRMVVDLLGETWIHVAINGSPVYDYVTPSFCDAMTVPVLTGNENLALQLASDFETVIGQTYDHELGIGGQDLSKGFGKL